MDRLKFHLRPQRIAIAALPDLLEQLVEVVASSALADADDGRVGRLALRLNVGLQPGHALLVLQALLAALRGVEHEVGDVLPVRGVLLHVFGFLSNPQTYARPSASIPRTENARIAPLAPMRRVTDLDDGQRLLKQSSAAPQLAIQRLARQVLGEPAEGEQRGSHTSVSQRGPRLLASTVLV